MTERAPPEADGNAGRLLVIACGMLAREILAIRESGQLHHVDITCLPAQLHFEPEKLPGAMQRAIGKAKALGYGAILAGYGDCGTGGRLDDVLAAEGVQRISGPHCFAFYQGMDAFAAREPDDVASFYFTDFLVRNFRTFFVEPLGLDRHPELIGDYFGRYERVVYLAQTDDRELDSRAKKAAAWLGLAYERRLTGYGDLEAVVSGAAGRP